MIGGLLNLKNSRGMRKLQKTPNKEDYTWEVVGVELQGNMSVYSISTVFDSEKGGGKLDKW